MALTQCSFSSRISHCSQTPISVTLKPQSSPSSSPKPSKLTRRKNHLRLKLLKPYPAFPQSTPPQHPHKSPPQEPINIDQFPSSFADDEQQQLPLQGLQTSPTPEAESVISNMSVIEFRFFIFGLFVAQTIATLWVLNSSKVGEESQEADLNLKKKEGFWLTTSGEAKPDDGVHVDDPELEKKIVEIRAMAYKVRELEAKKLRISSDESVPKPVITKVKTNILQEVEGRLDKFERKLSSLGEERFAFKVSHLNTSNEVSNGKRSELSDATVKNENLVFKKKVKFKNGLSQPRHNPKGFGNMSNGNNRTSTAHGSGNDLPNGHLFGSSPENNENSHFPVDNSPGNTVIKVAGKSEQHDSSVRRLDSTQEIRRKSEKEGKSSKSGEGMTTKKNKPRSGIVQESSHGLVQPKDSAKLKKDNSSNLTRQLGYKEEIKNNKDDRRSIENDTWWLNLPYALAILLRRSSETEGPGGFYSLKGDDGSSSHIVAFEDQRDASNFCYIVEAFFDELGDFSADVVPLSIKDLKDELETNAKKIVVVRKGQLQLYAGQPLAEVETTLWSLLS